MRASVLMIVGVCVLSACASPPVAPIDTTEVDNTIVALADNAGTIETQVVTVYETVHKMIYNESPEKKALVERQFAAIQLSVTQYKALVRELARVHAVEVGRYAARISYLEPFEAATEKEKGKKWKAYAFSSFLLLIILSYCAFKSFRL